MRDSSINQFVDDDRFTNVVEAICAWSFCRARRLNVAATRPLPDAFTRDSCKPSGFAGQVPAKRTVVGSVHGSHPNTLVHIDICLCLAGASVDAKCGVSRHCAQSAALEQTCINVYSTSRRWRYGTVIDTNPTLDSPAAVLPPRGEPQSEWRFEVKQSAEL